MMHNFFTRMFTRYPRKTLRLLEIMPPLLAVFLISMPFWGAIFFPVQLSYFIIFFDVYWLYKSFNLAVTSFMAARKIKKAEKEDWLEKAKLQSNYSKIAHIVIVPTYKESVAKISETLESIASQTLPLKKIFVFMAFEAREEGVKEKSHELTKLFGNKFGGFYSAFHPDDPSEVKGKSSNQAYAGRLAEKTLIDTKKIDIDFTTISSVDADSIFDRQFFACLSYKFLSDNDPYHKFWQSANVFYNNFWQVPSFIRIIAFFNSLARISLLVQGMRLIPNAVYTLSFRLLKSVNYWDTDVIPEDYRIFFKAFFLTGGKVNVEPIFLKTSMDAPKSPTYAKSIMNKYHQEKRWSWGISDDAIYIRWWLTVKEAPFIKKTYLVGNVVLDHIMWPVNWYIVTISANLIVFLNPVFTKTALGYNLPRISGFILTLCLLALFVLIYVDFTIRNRRDEKISRFRKIIFPVEFILMPISGFFLSSLPALISHMQLILGKRPEYKVTEKS